MAPQPLLDAYYSLPDESSAPRSYNQNGELIHYTEFPLPNSSYRQADEQWSPGAEATRNITTRPRHKRSVTIKDIEEKESSCRSEEEVANITFIDDTEDH
ncbi:hypothetical protein JAAARDRAFT_198081 [Jaapia argillacea MUCL 33604]|uniref:Uncharacterized protein n=1 Tax=Jaapia argillacea MUCL 33604 TaxID=933084 RepID=A0A067PFX0_9AGAM|nr:hypothetical protein JAAARDRAFT_198081 [Jaapia argillacea MUCL 33604]